MIAVWLSEKLLGHFWGAVDILALLWLYISGLGFFIFCSALGLGFGAAAFGAAAWSLAPFIIFLQTSWWIVGTAAACFPWMMYGTLRIYVKGDGPGFAALAFSTGILCLMHHPQYAVYGCGVAALFFAAMLLADGNAGGGATFSALFSRNRRAFAVWLAAATCGWLVGAVTVLPMYAMMHGAHYRGGAIPFSDFSFLNFREQDWIAGLFWPRGAEQGGGFEKLAYLGYVVPALAAFLFFRPARKFFTERKVLIIVFAALAAFCLAWSFGWFNHFEYRLPFFNRLRWHFRVLLFADFFFCVLASLGFEAAVSKAGARGKVLAALLVGLQMLNMSLFYGLTPRFTLRTHEDEIPAIEPLAARLAGGRILSVGYGRDEARSVASLGFDYATLFSLCQFAGYEVLLPEAIQLKTLGLNYNAAYDEELSAERLGHFRVWGVRWYVTAPYKLDRYARFYAANGLREIYRDVRRVIFEDKAALPLVFRPGNPAPAGEAAARGNSLSVRLADSNGGCFAVNWLYADGMAVSAEGGAAQISPLQPTGHIQVCASPGVESFAVRYSNRWFKAGMIVSALGAASAAILAVIL
jgi:hypothetical protein